MAQPDLIITPFADSAVPGTIDPIPESQDPALPQRASWLLGFPGVTMTPLAAGGIPPRGQDFNGVLNALSQHIVWLGRGGQYVWDAEIAAADGYPLGALLQKIGIDGFWLNTVEGNATNPDAGGAGWVDANSATLPYANDTGAANAYVATYTPAISSLTTGQVVRFKSSNANTGASTFNPNGLGAKPIVSISGAPLAAGAISANGHVWLQYDSAIGGGSWVSLLSSSASDSLNSAVATVAAAATINLTAGAPSTSQISISGTGVSINGFTVAANRFFVVKMLAAGNTLVNSASLVTGRGANIQAGAGDSFLMRSTSANTVEIVGYTSTQFYVASFGATSYRVSPKWLDGGTIEAWGSGITAANGRAIVTLPLAMADLNYDVQVTAKSNAVGTAMANEANSPARTTTTFEVYTLGAGGGTPASSPFQWHVIGKAP